MSALKYSQHTRATNRHSALYANRRQRDKSARPPRSIRGLQPASLDPAVLTPQEVLQLQRTVGNQAISRLLPSTPAPVLAQPPQPVGAPIIQRATLVVNDTESKEDPEILVDAKAAHAGGVLYDMNRGQVEINGKKKNDTHLDVFGHGHQGEIGMYGEAQLVDEIAHLHDTLKLTELQSLTLHSCDSAVPLDTSGEKTGLKLKYSGKDGTTLAERVNQEFLKKDKFVITKGFQGPVFTDSEGETRVIKDLGQEKNYKYERNHAKGTAAKKVVENKYLHPASEKNVEYGREQVMRILSLREDWQGQLSEEELRQKWDEYVKWKEREEDDLPTGEGESNY